MSEYSKYQIDRRELDVLTAKRAEFYISRGVLYTRNGTVLGGDTHAYFAQQELEDDSDVWRGWSPAFTRNVDDALMLWDGLEGLQITTSRYSDGIGFSVWGYFGYLGFGENHSVRQISLDDLAYHIVVAWHMWKDCEDKWKAYRSDKLRDGQP